MYSPCITKLYIYIYIYIYIYKVFIYNNILIDYENYNNKNVDILSIDYYITFS